jgi:PfaB family protein
MLAVIGVDVCLGDVNGIDAFDFHLYHNKEIRLKPSFNHENGELFPNTINVAQRLIDKLLTVNHLSRSDTFLIVVDALNKPRNKSVIDPLCLYFKSSTVLFSLSDALLAAKKTSNENKAAVVILSLGPDQKILVSGVLVCSKSLLDNEGSQLGLTHCYAEIETVSSMKLLKSEKTVNKHILQFLSNTKVGITGIESILTHEQQSLVTKTLHHQQWLIAYYAGRNACHNNSVQHVTHDQLCDVKTTLLTSLDCVQDLTETGSEMICFVASILCLDQAYRLGTKQALVQDKHSQQEQIHLWEASPFYYLPASTSHLSNKHKMPRRLLMSQCNDTSHQLILLCQSQRTSEVISGFLAQHPIKPVIFKASSVERLMDLLTVTLEEKAQRHHSFYEYCVKQYQSYEMQLSTMVAGYCIVLMADCFDGLKQQITLALTGIVNSIATNKPWKTPVGSYFSGQHVDFSKVNKPVTFLYPGVGALYVNMGKDLLRLFPAVYQTLSELSDDIATSLQDRLITPRLVSDVNFEQQKHLDNQLRHDLVNIAEAGVSYACLLTTILQQQLTLEASAAAGYSMGEVSMFAGLGCWQNPSLLSDRLRNSDTFTKQLTGPLMRLTTVWGEEGANKTIQWESYHIKAGVMQVKAIIDQFPRVYLTIVNTAESLVIAGEPAQCLQLAKQLNVRAIALDVHNIIHCELAKSEYENMLKLYALPIKGKLTCQLFSSSCYLPIPITEKAIAVSISKCLTELVDFPRLITNIHASGETVFIEVGAGKSLSTWVERILKNSEQAVTCLAVNQKKLDDYSAILKTIVTLISLGYHINLQDFFNGSLIRPIKKVSASVLVS